MKTNKLMRVASVLLVAVLISAYAVSLDFARYASDVVGEDTTRVAKWEFSFGTSKDDKNPTLLTQKKDFTFNLFDTVNDLYDAKNSEHQQPNSSVKEGKETDIKSTNGDKIIAPGTMGQGVIKLTNKSEVDAYYSVTMEGNAQGLETNFIEGEAMSPSFSFGFSGDQEVGWISDITQAKIDRTLIKAGETVTIAFDWRWEFNRNGNRYDNEYGYNADTYIGDKAITFTAIVTVEQADLRP